MAVDAELVVLIEVVELVPAPELEPEVTVWLADEADPVELPAVGVAD